jgi:hypothetical protein
MDGRKQRFSRFSVRKLSQGDADYYKSDEDTSSVDVPVTVETSPSSELLKRTVESANTVSASATKRSRLWYGSLPSKEEEQVELVDDSMLDQSPTKTLVANDELPVAIAGDKQDRLEMFEQSLVVSEVAMKLEQFARKAMKGRSRAHRHAITPPFGAFDSAFSTSSGVLTYDDEDYGYECDDHNVDRRSSNGSFGGLVTESEAYSLSDDESSLAGFESSSSSSVFSANPSPPVDDHLTVHSIVQRLLSWSHVHAPPGYSSVIMVARFCMSTSPAGDKDLISKILRLITSCDFLMSEFQSYRSALDPTFPSLSLVMSVQQIWARAVSRSDAVHDFKIFSVNCIRKLLGSITEARNVGSMTLILDSDRAILEYTADVWQKSVGLF